MNSECLNESVLCMFLDNELEPEEKTEIITHLDTCAHCRELLQQLEQENHGLKEIFGISTAAEPPDLALSVMKKIEPLDVHEDHPRQRRSNPGTLFHSRWLWASAASILLAAFMILYFLFLGTRSPLDTADTDNTTETNIVLCSARVGGQDVQSHIYQPKDTDLQFIWLEKEK